MLKKLTLLVTDDCNLRCKYCYQQYKEKHYMSFETAKRIVAERFSEPYDNGLINLIGGETFMNFSLIKQLFEYVQENYKNITFTSFTNGTLIHNDVSEWLAENKDKYEICVSIDGARETHNSMRVYPDGSGSFDSIDFDYFIDTLKVNSVSLTVAPDTVKYIASSIKWIESKGLACQALFSMGIKWDFESIKNDLVRQMKLLIKYYTENPQQKKCLFLRYDFKNIENNHDCSTVCDIYSNPCYDYNGKKYSCTGFSTITVGDETGKFNNMTINDFISERNTCTSCKWFRLCRSVKLCYASNYLATGDVHTILNEQCIISRMCIFTSAVIEGNKIMKNGINEENKQEYENIKYVKENILAYEELKLFEY